MHYQEPLKYQGVLNNFYQLEGKQYSNNFQEYDCLRYLKVPFLPCYVTPEKGAGNSNRVRNHVLESLSNIFFTLIP